MLDVFNPYYQQMTLLMDLLRVSSSETCFALKGGTAINLFYRDLPRLSVDIDLTYLPLEPRKESLKGIQKALERMSDVMGRRVGGIRVVPGGLIEGVKTKLLISRGPANVKIEVSAILRGSVRKPMMRNVSDAVENIFGSAEVQALSFQDTYAGKICAALDRQHPRDFFDAKLLLENEGVDDELMTFKSGNPDWSMLGLPDVEKLPSIQWKLQNVRRMDAAKRENALEKLRMVLKV